MILSAKIISLPAWCWLRNTRQATVHAAFAQAANFVNDQGDWLSLTVPAVGVGPFGAIVPLAQGDWRDWLRPGMPAFIHQQTLSAGNLSVQFGAAALWDPRPDWERVSRSAPAAFWMDMAARLPPFSLYHQPYAARVQAALAELDAGLRAGQVSRCARAAGQLGGLGPGLTPAGDDFLLGVMIALRLGWPAGDAQAFSMAMVDTVCPRTSALSAAWLKAAAAGEVADHWHDLLRVMVAGDKEQMPAALQAVLSLGASSGADALAGFVWAGQILFPVP